MKIKVWIFPFECYSCHNIFDAVYPEDVELNYVGPELENRTYANVKQINNQWVNVCPTCGKFQGDFYIMDACLEWRNTTTLDAYIIEVFEKIVPCDLCGNTDAGSIAVEANTVMCQTCYDAHFGDKGRKKGPKKVHK